MPIRHSKSPRAFKHNVEVEVHAGKPLKQALAIAYSVKRKGRHAKGGMIPAEDHARGHDKIHHESHEAGVHSLHPGKGKIPPHLQHVEHESRHDEEHDEASMHHPHEAVESVKPHPQAKSEHGHGKASHLHHKRAIMEGHPERESEHYAHGGSVAERIHHHMKRMAKGGELHGIDQDPETDYTDEHDMEGAVDHMDDDFLTADHGGHDGESAMDEFMEEEAEERGAHGEPEHPHLAKILESVRKRHYGRR